MNEQAGRNAPRYHRRGRRPAEGAAPADAAPEGAASADAAPEGAAPAERGEIHLKGTASLERLRDRVELAARELRRLREENAALAERLRDLEASAGVVGEGTTISWDESPEALRRKVTGFIEAIDQYLEKESPEGQ